MASGASSHTTLADIARSFLRESDESARVFLRQSWLSHVVSSLRTARIEAGLTQRDVATRLGTTQSAIARLENDDEGSMSLRRVIDYALACGVSPFDVCFRPFEEQRAFALEEPDGSRTEGAFISWRSRIEHRAWAGLEPSRAHDGDHATLEFTSQPANPSSAWTVTTSNAEEPNENTSGLQTPVQSDDLIVTVSDEVLMSDFPMWDDETDNRSLLEAA